MKLDFYQAGYDWAAFGEEPYVMPLERTTEERHFDLGVAAGKAVLREAGGIKPLGTLLERTEALQKRAFRHHALVLNALATLPEKERSQLLLGARIEPCATCRSIAICERMSLTCEAFRHYAAGTRAPSPPRVPDAPFVEKVCAATI